MMIIFLLLIFLPSCSSSPIEERQLETFSGRDRGIPIYKAFVPTHWQRIDPDLSIDLRDTMQPICTFEFNEIRLTIHNFPQRIAPISQIERWKNQIKSTDIDVTVYAHGGFGGYRLESDEVIGYAMQLTPILYREMEDSELRSDYTLKAVGKKIDQEKENIKAFADSFELINPLPSPL